MEYWFNTATNQVVRGDDPERPRLATLMGPYASEEEARNAYATAAEKTEAWDEEERAEDEWAAADRDDAKWDPNPFNDPD